MCFGSPMMKCKRTLTLSALLGVTLALAVPTRAADFLPSVSGWFEMSGGSARFIDEYGAFQDNQNYFVGGIDGQEYRNFFVFDFTGRNTTITDATLNLYNPSWETDDDDGFYGDATETFQLTSTTASVGQLAAIYTPNSTSGQAVFDTLGTGMTIGSLVASAADNGRTLSLTFNAAGLTYLNAHLGQRVALGGRLTSLTGTNNQFLFAYTNPNGGSPYLPLTPQVSLTVNQNVIVSAPEGSTMALLAPVLLGLGGMGVLKRRKRAE